MMSFRLERVPRLRSGQAQRAKWRNPSMLSFRLERVKRAEWRNPLNFNLRDSSASLGMTQLIYN